MVTPSKGVTVLASHISLLVLSKAIFKCQWIYPNVIISQVHSFIDAMYPSINGLFQYDNVDGCKAKNFQK